MNDTKSSSDYTEDFTNRYNHTQDFTDNYGSVGIDSAVEAAVDAVFSSANHILAVINAAIFVFGMGGNIWMIVSKPLCLGAHHIYVKNLCIVNILSILFLPFFVVSQFTDEWIFGVAMCKIVSVPPPFSWAATPFLHIILNADFLHKLKNPQEHSGTKRPWIFCGILYFFCIIPCSIPGALLSGSQDVWPRSNPDYTCTMEYFSMPFIFALFYLVSLVVQYILPIIIVCPIFHAGKKKLSQRTADLTSYNDLDSTSDRKLSFNLVNLVGYFLIYGLYWITTIFLVFFVFEANFSSRIDFRSIQQPLLTISRIYTVFMPAAYLVLKRRYKKDRSQDDDVSVVEIQL